MLIIVINFEKNFPELLQNKNFCKNKHIHKSA